MEWLKEILKDVENADTLIVEIKKGIGKNFVSKADFNDKNEELKSTKQQLLDRDKQLEDLKKIDPKKLTDEIENLKKVNADKQAEYEKELHNIKVESALEKELLSSGAKNIKAVKALLDIDFENIKIDDTGKLENISTVLESIKTSDPYLFESKEGIKKGFTGVTPNAGNPNPGGKPDSEKSYDDFIKELESK